jgi:anti-anti-sigma regulatory factor
MMKISVVESQSRLRLVIEGKLVAPWTAELRRTWNSARSQLRGRALVIDLRSVTHISREGENSLLDLMTEGARFTCKGVFIRRVLEQLARQCRCRAEPAVIALSNDSDDED